MACAKWKWPDSEAPAESRNIQQDGKHPMDQVNLKACNKYSRIKAHGPDAGGGVETGAPRPGTHLLLGHTSVAPIAWLKRKACDGVRPKAVSSSACNQ